MKKGIKNFLIYQLFNLIVGVVIPLILVLLPPAVEFYLTEYLKLDNSWIQHYETANSILFKILVFLVIIYCFLLKETLVCHLTKRKVKNTYKINEISFGMSLFNIFIATFFLLKINYSSNIIPLIVYTIYIICQIISYILIQKYVLKDKIKFKTVFLIGIPIYTALVILLFYCTTPSALNKWLFNTFGSTDLSTKQLHIDVVNNYNARNCNSASFIICDKNINYTQKLTEEIYKEIYHIEEYNNKYIVSQDDINKFPELESIVLVNHETIDLDFSKHTKLSGITLNNCNLKDLNFLKNTSLGNINIINNSKINQIDTTNINNISRITIEDSEIKDLIINNSTNDDIQDSILNIKNGKVNNLKITGNKIYAITIKGTSIQNLEIANTPGLYEIDIRESEVKNSIIDNIEPIKYYDNLNVKIEKIDELTIKNINDLEKFIENSSFTFKTLNYLDNKQLYLKNKEIITLDRFGLDVPIGTNIKEELILKNSSSDVKILETEFGLGSLQIYDSKNNKTFTWEISGY